MFKTYIACLLLAAIIVFGMAGAASAAEVECDSIYCFQTEDFPDEELQGICITSLPDAKVGTVMLGTRVLRPGDILTAAQLPQMTFLPLRTERRFPSSGHRPEQRRMAFPLLPTGSARMLRLAGKHPYRQARLPLRRRHFFR